MRDFLAAESTYHTLSSFAVRNGVVLVNVPEEIKKACSNPKYCKDLANQLKMRNYAIEANEECFPSHYNPETVISIIQDYIKTLPFTSKNIMIFNYPSADLWHSEKLVYPRASDELHAIEEALGPVCVLYNVLSKKH